MNVLIIGAGATGQIFARHLQDGGAEITFLVREPHREYFESIAQAGLPLYKLNDGRNAQPYFLRNYTVCYSIDSLPDILWDQVWFCVPSNALDPTWISDIARSTGNASMVLLSPEGNKRLDIEEKYLDRVLNGYITFIAWQSPLEGESIEGPNGIAYWFPFGTKVPLLGPKERLNKVVEMLKKGGMPVMKGSLKSTGGSVRLLSSILMPLVAGLECAGWSFRAFTKSKWAKVVSKAAFEAYQVTGKKESAFIKGLFWLFLNPFTLAIGLRISPLLMPFDFEKYMKFHFTKIRSQTIWILKGMLEDAKPMGIDTPNLELLKQKIS